MTTKEILRNLVAWCEQLQLENLALRAILTASPCAQTRQSWKGHLDRSLADNDLRDRIHEKFALIYAEIEAARDETAIRALVAKGLTYEEVK